MSEKDIAVRLFNNHKYGTTQGKAIYNRAIYNASAELRNPASKYLLDFYQFDDLAMKATTDEQIMTHAELAGMGFGTQHDTVFSWVQHYDPLTKVKITVAGVAILDTGKNSLRLLIDDAVNELSEMWILDVVSCKNAGTGKPAYLASNIDVGKW